VRVQRPHPTAGSYTESSAPRVAANRSDDSLAGLILMGVRLYNPATGRFLSVDPIPGGNANPYTYPTDPINQMDLTGQCWSCGWIKKVAKAAWKNRSTIVGAVALGACAIGGPVACGSPKPPRGQSVRSSADTVAGALPPVMRSSP
jgi:RHS repeat-associated protein